MMCDKGNTGLHRRLKMRDRMRYLFSPSVFRRSTYNFSNCSVNFSETNWGRDLRNEAIQDPRSSLGKSFRRRFRISYPLFLSLWAFCAEKNIFGIIKRSNRVIIPVEIRLLICLRILARGECLDTIVECSNVKQSTVHKIFRTFLRNFSSFKELFIPTPNINDIRDNLLLYAQLGLPGCIGSLDCTHLHWRMCPIELTNYCHSKRYPFPTVAFQVSVNHQRKILSVGELFYGGHNDKTINRYDAFVNDVKDKKLFQDETFKLFSLNGSESIVKGVYFLSDNGYTESEHFIMPSKIYVSSKEMYWSEWIESVRKDVECTFGLLKTRFRIIWNGILYHDKVIIEQIFLCCCMLHNIILGYDCNSTSDWEHDVDWEKLHPEEYLPEDCILDTIEELIIPEQCLNNNHQIEGGHEEIDNYNESVDNNVFYTTNIDDRFPKDLLIMDGAGVKLLWDNLEWKKYILINHFAVMYRKRAITWPRAFEARLKKLCPIKRNANAERIVYRLSCPGVDINKVYSFLLSLILYI
jgi:hypothetical protein